MPERTSYVQGTPNWVDLETSDQEAAKAFYGGLFGWTYVDEPMPQGGAYSMAFIGDKTVAAISAQGPDMAAQGIPPMWNTYIAVDDVDATTAKVAGAGGMVAMEPFDVMDAGRMSGVMDPTGAFCMLWQAKNHIGGGLVNEPGTLIWNELQTADTEAAVSFYEAVVGLEAEESDVGGGPYTVFKAGGRVVAGTMPPASTDFPSHWSVYFGTADAAATAERVKELGGSVIAGPFDTPIGPMAVLRDPQGAFFSVFQVADQEE